MNKLTVAALRAARDHKPEQKEIAFIVSEADAKDLGAPLGGMYRVVEKLPQVKTLHFGPASRTRCGKESRNVTQDKSQVTCKTCRARLGLDPHPWTGLRFGKDLNP